jgi:predicted TIM-barrel fold metal-dependent hydrolase
VRSADHLIAPWFDRIRDDLGDHLDLFDAHTHIGFNDPDGFSQTAEELLERLEAAGARAVVFPMHEPDGYTAANDAVLAAAAGSDGRLTAFCRVDPHVDAIREVTRALDAGARGIKLHPRAEGFTLAHPVVRELAALADERRAPILIHAGRGIPALGRDTVHLAEDFPDARLILAHAAISDLAWLWRVLPDHPNVLIDTSWWNVTDLIALFTLVPPGQVLFASDSPYGSVVQSAVVTFRSALQAGLTPEQIHAVAGAQMQRLVDGDDLIDAGPAPGPPGPRVDVLLERVADNLLAALSRRVLGSDGDEPIALARLACAVGEDVPQAELCRSALALIDRSEAHRRLPDEERLRFSDLHVIACALAVVRTPDVPVPDLGATRPPEREAIPSE